MPVTVRAVFILNPAKKVALTITYPPAVGRNFAEVLRVVDALQRGAKHPVATPVDWKAVRVCCIVPACFARTPMPLAGRGGDGAAQPVCSTSHGAVSRTPPG